jgi:hypothetical protein
MFRRIDMDKINRNTTIRFSVSAFIPFALVLLGLKLVSGRLLSMQNAFLLLGFCVLIGIVSSLLHSLKLKSAYYFFNAGILIGLFEMYRHFFQDLNGWEDLTGLASLFIWILIGLCGGLILQLAHGLYKKYIKKDSK